MSGVPELIEQNYYEASARDRIAGLLDPASFHEFLGPEQRAMSPHLAQFNLTGAFDDGLIVGAGRLDGRKVYVAAQEGRFMGGAFGEVHGAKLTGLLRAARDGAAKGVRAVVLLLDTGGVRLQEANAGELSISETVHAIVETRAAGVPVLALVGGRSGAFGGGGIVTAFCSRIIVSDHARIGVSGPEVIETNKGVEEFELEGQGIGLARHRRTHAGDDGRGGPFRARSDQGFPRRGHRAHREGSAIHSGDTRRGAEAARRAALALRRLS